MILSIRNKLMALQKAYFIQALVTAALMLKTAQACSCAPIFSGICGYFDDADVVLHGTVLSRTEESVAMHDFTTILAKYTVDTITLFKGESGTFYSQEITFSTAESDALCGVNPTIGEEYVFGLYADNQLDSADELGLSAYLCGLNMEWSMVNEGVLNECGDDPCDGECDEFEECMYYENNGKWYCSETCLDGACDEGEYCEMKTRNWCNDSGYPGCPRKRVCTSFV